MKVSVIITTLLVAQVSASFFDVFQGAVLSVQNSFGKLLSDVVTDVKETVDCTILAVEHVLSLSHDATTRYYHKCGSEINKTDSVSDARQDASLPKVEFTLNLPNNEDYLQKVIPAEIDARINETLSKVLGNLKPHDNVLSIENVFAKESEQLAGVSILVKKELEKLSNEVTKDLNKMEKQKTDSEASVDTILQEIKVLEKSEQNSKNASETNEIHQVIDQVLGKLDAIEATEATENFKLEEILKDLESNSNNSLVGLRHQFDEWKEEESRHLSEIKSQIEEHKKLNDHQRPYNKDESNQTQPVIFNKDNVDTNENSQDISSYNTTQVKETLNNTASSRTIGNTNENPLLVANLSSSFQNYTFNELNDTVTKSTSYSSVERPPKNMVIPFENPYASIFSELTTLFVAIQNNVTKDNKNETVMNTTVEVIDRARVNETIQPDQSMPNSDKQKSLTSNEPFLPINKDKSNKTFITTLAAADTSSSGSGKVESPNLPANNNTLVTSAAQVVLESFKNENSKDAANISTIVRMMVGNAFVNTSNFENEPVTTLNHIESSETMTPRIPTSLNISTPVTGTILSIKSSTATVNEEFSIVTAKIVSDNDSNYTSSTTILESTSITENEPEQTAVAFGGDQPTKELSIIMRNNVSNDTLVMSPSIPSVENSPVSETMQPEQTGTTGNRHPTEVITESITTSTGRYGGDSDTTLVNTPIPTTSKPEGEKIQTTLSTSTTTSSANKETSTITTKIIYGNYPNNAMITTDPSIIIDTTPLSKNLETEELRTASDKETSSINSNVTLETTTSSTLESTLVSDTIQPEENSTSAGNGESTEAITESTSSITDSDSETTITSTPTIIIRTSTPESETIQAVDTTTLSTSEKEYLTSTANKLTETPNTADDEGPLPSTTNSPKTSPAPFPISEMTKNTTFSEDEETSISTSPATVRDEVAIENNDSINIVTSKTQNTDSTVVNEIILKVETTTASEEEEVRTPPLTITPPVNREQLTPNQLNQQKYNANGEQRNYYEFNDPISLSERLLQIRQPLIDPEVPMYSQAAMPPITRGLFKDASKWLPPNGPIPDFPSQLSKIDNNALQEATFDIFDSAHERLLHSDLPSGPDIFRNVPLIPNTPREPKGPPRMNDENPSYAFDSAPENMYRQLSLTTNRPAITVARANNYKNPSFDYDSFFHVRDPEAHKRAVKEARQLMANSKRSHRIINNIMKNKQKFHARSIFG